MAERKTQRRFTANRRSTQLRKDLAPGKKPVTGEILRSETPEAKRVQALKNIAKRLDTQFEQRNFKNVKEIEKELNKVPAEVKPYLSFNLDKVKKEQQKRLDKIQGDIERAKEGVERYDEYGDEAKDPRRKARYKARESGYKTELRELQKFQRKLKQGEIFDVNKAKDIADDIGDADYKKERAEAEQDQQLKKISASISRGVYNVNKINYKDGKPTSVEVQGKKVPLKGLSNEQLKNIKLSSVKTAEQKKEIKKGIDEALNSDETFRKLSSLGLKPDEATKVIAAYETGEDLNKVKDVNVDNIIKELQDSKGTLVTDRTTQERVFKIKVNQELNKAKKSGSQDFKPIDFTKNVDTFQKEYKKLLKKRKETFDKIKNVDKVEKDLKININNLRNKALTGQSMSPKQMAEYNALQIAAGEKLNKQQLNNLKKANVVLGAYTYGKNLRNRFEAGEKNPLYNDLTKVVDFSKGVATGAGKETGDLINTIFGVKGLTINSKGESFDGVVAKGARGTLEYMQKLIRETASTDAKAKKIIKDDLKKLWSDTKETGKNVIDASKVAAKHPFLTMLSVSAAINEGIVSSKNEFLKNPDENLGRALVWLFPGTIVKGATKGVKAVGSTAKKAKDINNLGRFFKKEKFTNLKAKFAGKPLAEQERALTITALKDRGINLRETDLDLIKTKDLKNTLNQLTPKKPKTGKNKVKSQKVSKSLAKKRLLNNAFEEKFGVKLSDEALDTLTEKSLRNLLGTKKPKLLNKLKSLNLFKANGNIIPRKSIKVPKEKSILNTAFEEKFGVKLAPETLATLNKKQLNDLLGTNTKDKFTNLLNKFKVPKKVKVSEIKPNKKILNTAFEEKFGVKLSDEALDTLTEKSLRKLIDTKKKSELVKKLANSGLYIYNKNIERFDKVKDLIVKALKQKKRIKVPKDLVKEALRKQLRFYGVKYSPKKTQSLSINKLKKDLTSAIKKKEDIEVDSIVKNLDNLIEKQIQNKNIFIKLDKNEIKRAIAQDLKSKGLANLSDEQVLKTSIPNLQGYYKKPKTLKSTKEPVKEIKITQSDEKKAIGDLLRKQGINISDKQIKESSLSKLRDRLEKAKTSSIKKKEQEAVNKLSKGQLLTQLRQLGIKYSSDQAKKLSVKDLRNKLAREKSIIKAAEDVELKDLKEGVKQINLNEVVSKPIREPLRKNKKASLRIQQQLQQKQKSLIDESKSIENEIKEIVISPKDIIKSRIKLKSPSLITNIKDLERKMKIALKNSKFFDVGTSQVFKNALKSLPVITKAVTGIKSINGEPINYLAVDKSELNDIRSAFPELANKNIIITKQEFENLTDNLPKTDKKTTNKSDVIIITDNKFKSKVKELSKGRLKGKKISRTPRRPRRVTLPSDDFYSNAYRNRVVRYIAQYRERRNRGRPYNKRNNPIVTKRRNIETTRNRALKDIAELADRRTVRSIDVKVDGVTQKTKEDIKKPEVLKKFEVKKGTGPSLKLVEKASASIDTPGEKKELKRTRKAAKKKKNTKKSSSKKNTTKKSKKSSKSKPKTSKKKRGKKNGKN